MEHENFGPGTIFCVLQEVFFFFLIQSCQLVGGFRGWCGKEYILGVGTRKYMRMQITFVAIVTFPLLGTAVDPTHLQAQNATKALLIIMSRGTNEGYPVEGAQNIQTGIAAEIWTTMAVKAREE